MGHHVEANKELADMITRIERATQHILPSGTKSKSCDGLGNGLFFWSKINLFSLKLK